MTVHIAQGAPFSLICSGESVFDHRSTDRVGGQGQRKRKVIASHVETLRPFDFLWTHNGPSFGPHTIGLLAAHLRRRHRTKRSFKKVSVTFWSTISTRRTSFRLHERESFRRFKRAIMRQLLFFKPFTPVFSKEPKMARSGFFSRTRPYRTSNLTTRRIDTRKGVIGLKNQFRDVDWGPEASRRRVQMRFSYTHFLSNTPCACTGWKFF